jgi:hypothetical protein
MKKIRLVKFKTEEMAVEILNALKIFPKWQPVKRVGKPFSVQIKLPILYTYKI